MKPLAGRKISLKRLLRNERGAVTIALTIYLPFFVGITTLAVDMSYVLWTRNQLQVTAEAAALAATYQLPDNSSCTQQGSACYIAREYARKNLPENRYGNVLAESDVVVGKWTAGCLGGGASNESCFVPVPANTSCVTFGCNGVKVTTRRAAANGNALPLTFASYVGWPTFDVSATAIAVFGNDPSAPKWNVIIALDVSGSFEEELPQGKAAAQALLNCMRENAPTSSKLGITLFAGCSGPSCTPGLSTFQPMEAVDTRYETLRDKIGDPNNRSSGIQNCVRGTGRRGVVTDADRQRSIDLNTPLCETNTSQASGLQWAQIELCPNRNSCPSATANNAIILISDGLPVPSDVNRCNGSQCTADQLKQMARDQATAAATKGIDIYTIYYGSDNNGRNFLAELSRNAKNSSTAPDPQNSFDTPEPNKLSDLMQAICSKALQHRLVW